MLHFHTDGSCLANGTPKAKATWAYKCDQHEASGFVEGSQSSNTGELYAVKKALEYAVGKTADVLISSDSQYAVNCIQGKWKRKKNIGLLDEIDNLINEFASVRFIWVKGHAEDQRNNDVDNMAYAMLTGKKRDESYGKPRNVRDIILDRSAPTCVYCGVRMVTRRNKENRSTFYGCARFPRCRYTEPV